jgi:hypothetical protein
MSVLLDDPRKRSKKLDPEPEELESAAANGTDHTPGDAVGQGHDTTCQKIDQLRPRVRLFVSQCCA